MVVDIGCGVGADFCIAASLIGKSGQAIGIDLTPAIVAKARDNAQRAGLGNIIVYQADISDLPLPDACADVVISNGVINLAADKQEETVVRKGSRHTGRPVHTLLNCA